MTRDAQTGVRQVPRFKTHVPPELQEEWASITEAQVLLAVDRKKVFQLMKAKLITAKKYLGNRTFVNRESISNFLKRSMSAAK